MQGTNRSQVSRSRGKERRHNNSGPYHRRRSSIFQIYSPTTFEASGLSQAQPANTINPINLQLPNTHLRALPGIDRLGCIHRLDSILQLYNHTTANNTETMNTPQAYHPSGLQQIPASYVSYHQPVGSQPTTERQRELTGYLSGFP